MFLFLKATARMRQTGIRRQRHNQIRQGRLLFVRLLAVTLIVLLAGCSAPCQPEWFAAWEDPSWYEATLTHPGRMPWGTAIYDLGIHDDGLDAYAPAITRNLMGPGGELYRDEAGHTLRVVVAANETLEAHRPHVAPMLEALGLDIDAVFADLAKHRSIAEALQADGKTTVIAYGYTAIVEPDLQPWWDAIGGFETANITAMSNGAYLRWDEWRVQVYRVGHDIVHDGVAYHLSPSGRVQAAADESVGAEAFLTAIAAFAADHGVAAPDVSPHLTDCIVRW